mmetsp:Transcript_38181/g.108418  ORF Transcript_38181/g.108418 Transcript_38181/m.108418 type:complete len:205 (-) Transcript_38181:171-785(-)
MRKAQLLHPGRGAYLAALVLAEVAHSDLGAGTRGRASLAARIRIHHRVRVAHLHRAWSREAQGPTLGAGSWLGCLRKALVATRRHRLRDNTQWAANATVVDVVPRRVRGDDLALQVQPQSATPQVLFCQSKPHAVGALHPSEAAFAQRWQLQSNASVGIASFQNRLFGLGNVELLIQDVGVFSPTLCLSPQLLARQPALFCLRL